MSANPIKLLAEIQPECRVSRLDEYRRGKAMGQWLAGLIGWRKLRTTNSNNNRLNHDEKGFSLRSTGGKYFDGGL